MGYPGAMRVLIPLIVLVSFGCMPTVNTRPLRTCNAEDPTVDCCVEADECVTYYGADFSFCATPGRETGRCVECTVDEHCDLDAYCKLDDDVVGPYCAPLPQDDE